jgi:hypothetical protein
MGGGWKLANFFVAASIWRYFTKPKLAIATTTTVSIKIIRRAIGSLLCG